MGQTAASPWSRSGDGANVEDGSRRSLTAAPKPGWDEYPGDGKGEQMATGCVGGIEEEDPQSCPYIYRLKYDLANSYWWSGNLVKDYFFFVMQWHPLLGIFMCHPNHPWTKLHRFYMLLISAGITFPMACVAFKAGEEAAANAPEGAEEVAREGAVKFLTIFGVTLPDTIIGVILYQLAIAETRCGCCPAAIPCAKALMKYGLYIACFFVVINLSIGYFIIGGDDSDHTLEDALQPLITGKVWSWATWFPLWIILPCQLGYWSLWSYEDKLEASKRTSTE